VGSGSEHQVVLDSLGLGVIVMVAYLAGAVTLPAVHAVSDRVGRRLRRHRAARREDLEELRGLLPDLQKAAEASGEAGGDRRFLDLNTELVIARDRVPSRAIREAVERYQHQAMNLVEANRAEAKRAPLLDQRGDVSGGDALGRMVAALKVRQDAWTALSEALTSVSEELRRR
jgi:hypothetical protein